MLPPIHGGYRPSKTGRGLTEAQKNPPTPPKGQGGGSKVVGNIFDKSHPNHQDVSPKPMRILGPEREPNPLKIKPPTKVLVFDPPPPEETPVHECALPAAKSCSLDAMAYCFECKRWWVNDCDDRAVYYWRPVRWFNFGWKRRIKKNYTRFIS